MKVWTILHLRSLSFSGNEIFHNNNDYHNNITSSLVNSFFTRFTSRLEKMGCDTRTDDDAIMFSDEMKHNKISKVKAKQRTANGSGGGGGGEVVLI